MYFGFGFFFFKQKTAYEMRISDWSSDVCSSDLLAHGRLGHGDAGQEFDQAGGAAGELLKPLPLPIRDEARDQAAARAQMVEQVHEEGQVRLVHPLFIEGQDIDRKSTRLNSSH